MKYLIKFRLGKSVFERAIDPRFYIEDLKELGEAEVKIIKENIPEPEEEPTEEHLFHADLILTTDKPKESILEVLEFILEDGVEIDLLEGEEQAEIKSESSDKGGEIPPALLENYKLETEEILSRLRQSLEELGQDRSNPERINDIFRSFHTLKGNTGLILSYREEPNLKNLHEATHRAESVLQKARDEGGGLSESQVEALQEILDRLDDLFIAFSEGREEPAEDLLGLLDKLERGEGEQHTQSQHKPELTALLKVAEQYIPVFRDICQKEEITEEEEEFLKRALTTLHKVARDSGVEKLKKPTFELMNATGNADFQKLRRSLQKLSDDIEELLKESKKTEPRISQPRRELDTSRYVSKSNYLKVEEKLVAELMDVVGELAVFKEWIHLFAVKLGREYGSTEASKELKDNIHRFRNLMDSLQKKVLEMRMVPVSILFERFPKLVRDLSRMLGKKVEIKTEGGETKLDKVIVEKIAEPMIHLIRNSVDHGIEKVEERREIGKPETGLITTRAYQEGGYVVIEVSDDGKGIDVDKIRKKAIEKNLYTPEELEKMSKEEIMQIIFQPGFSTKDQATELSGRGVGMDVVARAIREFGGEVSISSEPGLGTTVKLTLPLTLAIRKILLVKIGDMTFGLPAESVSEVLRVGREEVKKVKGKKVIYHRNSVIELDFLPEKLSLNSTANGTLTVLIDNSLSYGVVVDDVLSTIDTVIKPVPDALETAEEINGITILGDGSIVYVLEVLK